MPLASAGVGSAGVGAASAAAAGGGQRARGTRAPRATKVLMTALIQGAPPHPLSLG